MKEITKIEELKVCPFCGKNNYLELETNERDDRPKCKWTAKITCLNCFASINSHGFEYTKEEAIEKVKKSWNRRF